MVAAAVAAATAAAVAVAIVVAVVGLAQVAEATAVEARGSGRNQNNKTWWRPVFFH